MMTHKTSLQIRKRRPCRHPSAIFYSCFRPLLRSSLSAALRQGSPCCLSGASRALRRQLPRSAAAGQCDQAASRTGCNPSLKAILIINSLVN